MGNANRLLSFEYIEILDVIFIKWHYDYCTLINLEVMYIVYMVNENFVVEVVISTEVPYDFFPNSKWL